MALLARILGTIALVQAPWKLGVIASENLKTSSSLNCDLCPVALSSPLTCTLLEIELNCTCPACHELRRLTASMNASSRQNVTTTTPPPPLVEEETLEVESCLVANKTCADYAWLGVACSDLAHNTAGSTSGFGRIIFARAGKASCSCGEDECADSAVLPSACETTVDEFETITVEDEEDLREAVGGDDACVSVLVAADVVLAGELRFVAAQTTVDGGGHAMRGRGSHRLIGIGSGAALDLKSMSLVDGHDDTIGGGCIFVGGRATLVATDVVLSKCTAAIYGGAISVWTGARATLTRVRMDNAASTWGGAVYVYVGGLFRSSNSSIVDATALSGGGISTTAGTVIVEKGSTLARGTSLDGTFGGGCMAAYLGGALVVNGSSLTDCVADEGGSLFGHRSSSVEVFDSRIARSSAGESGGTVKVVYAARLVIARSAVEESSTLGGLGGGGIYGVTIAPIVLEDTIFRRCSVVSDSVYGGGAMAIFGDVVLNGVSVEECASSGNGGGILAGGSRMSFRIMSSKFSENTASTNGGCILVSGGADVEIVDSVFEDCVAAGGDGGAIDAGSGASVSMQGVEIVRGLAGDRGGALALGQGSLASLRASRFASNSADNNGGAVSATRSVLHVAGGSSFIANVALGSGGGAVAVEEQSLLVVASDKGCVRVTLDFEAASSDNSVDSLFWIASTDETNVARRLGSDAIHVSTVARPEMGSVVSEMYCLPPGAYEAWTSAARGKSWNSGTWALEALGIDIIEDLVVEQADYTLENNKHTERAATFAISSSSSTTTPPAFEGNAALSGSGGAVYVADESSLLSVSDAAAVEFTENQANYGGAVSVGTKCECELVGGSFARNVALRQGGGVHAGVLSLTTVNHTVATANRATQGGFFASTVAEDVALYNVTATSNEATEEGGACFFDRCDMGVLVASSAFISNVAGTLGGGLAADTTSIVSVRATYFATNSAVDGGAVYNGELSEIDFEPTNSVRVVVYIDWTTTSVKCKQKDEDATCDSDINVCPGFRSSVSLDACDGCVCPSGENFVELRKFGSAEEDSITVGEPSADAVNIHEVYVDAGETYSVVAKSTTGNGWYGGSLTVVVVDAVGGRDLVVDALVFEPDNPYEVSATFAVPDPTVRSSKNVFEENEALRGGGAFFWTDNEPTGLSIATVVRNTNKAAFGQDIATPPRVLRSAEAPYVSESDGRALTPVTVVLEDEYGQLAIGVDETASITVSKPTGAKVASNLAQFLEGAAIFDTLVVTYEPNTTIDVVVDTSSRTVRESQVAVSIFLRACVPGEVVSGSRCQECDDDEYWTPDDGCKECVSGMKCNDKEVPLVPDRILTTLALERGFMRQSAWSRKPVECSGGENNPACNGDVGRIRCAEDSDALGPTCAACRRASYRDGDQCKKCGLPPSLAFGLKLALVCGAFFVMAYYTVKIILTRETALRTTAKMSRRIGRLTEKWRTLFVVFQILVATPQIANVRLPNNYLVITTSLSFLASINIPVNCLHHNARNSYFDRLFSSVCGPVVACAWLLALNVAYKYWHRNDPPPPNPIPMPIKGRRRSKFLGSLKESNTLIANDLAAATARSVANASPNVIRAMLLIVFVTYPSIASTIIGCFWCVSYDSPTTSAAGRVAREEYLAMDLALKCRGPTYVTWSFIAAAAVLTHVVGIPACFCLLLYRSRYRICPMVYCERPTWRPPKTDADRDLNNAAVELRSNDKSIVHLELLFAVYRPGFWMFEVLVCIHRFLITSVAAIVSENEATRALFMFLLALISTKAYGSFLPFIEDADNNLAEILHGIMSIALLCTFCIAADFTEASSAVGGFMIFLVVLGIACTIYLIVRDSRRELTMLKLVAELSVTSSRRISVSSRRFSASITDNSRVISKLGKALSPAAKVRHEYPSDCDGHGSGRRVGIAEYDDIAADHDDDDDGHVCIAEPFEQPE